MAYHFDLVQLCARVIAHGTLASAKPRLPKKSSSRPIGLASLAQGATLSIHTIFSTLEILRILGTLRTLTQLMGLGQTGAGGEGAIILSNLIHFHPLSGGEGAARLVVGEAQELELASASHPQLGAGHVTDQR